MIRFLWIAMLVFALGGDAAAHELRPGFLEIQQTGQETYTIRFKVPGKEDLRLSLRLPARICGPRIRNARAVHS